MATTNEWAARSPCPGLSQEEGAGQRLLTLALCGKGCVLGRDPQAPESGLEAWSRYS